MILDARGGAPALVGDGGERGGACRGAGGERRGRGLILRASCRCGRICSRSGRASTCCCCCCTTLPATAGRWRRCCAISRAVYGARCDGQARRDLRPLPVQYADYTLWQQEVLGQESDAGERDCAPACVLDASSWRGFRMQIELPTRPAAAGGVRAIAGQRVGLRCRASCTAGLLGLARASWASLFMVLQAGLAALLTRLGAGSDIAIGSPIAGRTDSALDDLVGFFVNTLVLRTDTSGASELPRAGLGGCGRAILRPTATRSCRSSGWLRCSTLRARCRVIRCSR